MKKKLRTDNRFVELVAFSCGTSCQMEQGQNAAKVIARCRGVGLDNRKR